MKRQAVRSPIRLAIRLYDWSAWCRQVVRGVQQFAHERGNWRIYVDVGPPGSGRVLTHVSNWDGIITGVLRNTRAYRRLMDGGTPVVAITATIPRMLRDIHSVRVNDQKVANVIGDHLRAGGFRRLAYFGTGAPGVVDHRAAAVTAFAQSHALPCSLYQDKGSTRAAARSALVRWVGKLRKPVGVIAWNMDVARRIVDACLIAGIDVPADVAVVAWDDDPMLAETLDPTISAAVLPAERLGYEAARLLGSLIEGRPAKTPPPLVDPPGVLHVRQSSDVSTLKDRDVTLAAQFIREHGAEPLRVDQVAATLQVSRRKLEQDFRRVTGKTLHEAIMEVRLSRAKQLLVETDWTLTRVARGSGLGTAKTLHVAFRNAENFTPTEYRSRFSVR